MSQEPSASYVRVWLTFLRNSLVREMAFRSNFLINVVTRLREMSPLYELAKEGVDLSSVQWAAH